VPLDLGAGSLSGEFPRSWILPLMKDQVQNTELGYFTEHMLPLAAALKGQGEEVLGSNEGPVYFCFSLSLTCHMTQ